MKRKHYTTIFFLVSTLLLVALQTNAQDARARFAEAEQLFESSQYNKALTKLDEVETMLGATNPRILYLRISTLYALLKNSARIDYETLDAIRGNSHRYLNDFPRANIPAEKIAEVKRINDEVNSAQYPRSREEFNNKRSAENAMRRSEVIQLIKHKIEATNCLNEAVQTYKIIKRKSVLQTTTFNCTDNGDVTIFMEVHDIENKKRLLKTMRRTIHFNIKDIEEVFRNGSKQDSYGDYSEGYIAINSKTNNITVRREEILNPKTWPNDFVAKNNVDQESQVNGSVFYYCNQDDVPALMMELRSLY